MPTRLPRPVLASLPSSILAGLAGLASLAPACGGGDGPPVTPVLVPGGGAQDPGIDGRVNVYVIDTDDDTPLAGAAVRVGDVDGTTDATGLFVARGVSGPQTIVAKATGHATAMWLGVDGANVTIPLDRAPADTSRPPQAQLTGSIEGWDALPSPEVNHVQVGLVAYSQLPALGARGNDLAQPAGSGNLPAAACVRVRGPATPCTWKLNARPGDIALGLMMLDVDNRGTGDPSDDATVVTGFSLKPITVVAGQAQTGIMMSLPAPDSAVRPTVDLGTPPAALTERGSIVGLDLGARGVWRLAGIDATRAGAVVPDLSIASGARYELVGVAREPVTDGLAADSIVIRRGIGDPSALRAGDWLAPPATLATNRTMVTFTRGAPGALHVAELTNAGLGVEGRKVMSIVFFDGSSQATLPVDFAPLTPDPLTLKVTALDVGSDLDAGDFRIDDLTAGLAGAASDTIAVP